VLAFVADVAFAHVFTATPAGPRVAHVPLMVDGTVVRFHLANSNALTPHLDGQAVLASVGGPGAYISPNWYVDGRGRVPTWNYVAVEIEGRARRLTEDQLVMLLDDTAASHEPRVGENWTRAKMDPARFAAMCRAITGFELSIDAVRATAKLSQDKSDDDARGVIAGLRATGNAAAATLVEQARTWP